MTPLPRILADSSRVEAFSDGVLAIAITLLVLDLRTAAHPGHVGSELLAQWPTYLAYVASFIYIGVVWVNHHALFSRITSVDTGLLWCNLALLLAASVLPFPTAELAFAMGHGTRGDKVSALVLYAVISSAMGATWLIMFSYLHRHSRLLREDVTATFFRSERLRAVAGIIAPVVPVLIGLASPPCGSSHGGHAHLLRDHPLKACGGLARPPRPQIRRLPTSPHPGAARGSSGAEDAWRHMFQRWPP